MARLLIAALKAGGHRVHLASRFRGYDGTGNIPRQRRLRARGRNIADRLVRRYGDRSAAERPQVWFTYHVYHKSPDWLGPTVAAALGIPYVVAEASHAPKREGGPWQVGVEGAVRAIGAADAVVGFNPVDAVCLSPLLRPGAVTWELAPFLNVAPYAKARAARADSRNALAAHEDLDLSVPCILAVAMMRPGDKVESFRVLGQALSRLVDRSWCLLVAGDGPARGAVEVALAPVQSRTQLLGAMAPADLPRLYAAADLYAWPSVGEAYGMALLEAQAAGVPVVAGDRGGVGRIVHRYRTGFLVPEGDANAFAGAVAELLDNRPRRLAMAEESARVARVKHDLPAAAWTLNILLSTLTR